MNRNNGTGVIRMQLPICDKTVTTEVAQDYSLPDYQPEIKRLLRVSAVAQPANRYVGGGNMEFSGAVDFCLLYAGNDGQMYCFPTSAEYAFRVPLEAGADFDLNDNLVTYATVEPDMIISRVNGPRRMSVKCRLRARVRAYGSCLLEEKRDGDFSGGEERLTREIEPSVSAYGISEPMTVSDEILLEHDGTDAGEWRVISGDAQVMVTEATCGSGKVNCRGDVIVKLIMQRENEGSAGTLPTTMTRKIPFSGEIPADGVTVNSEACAIGNCTQLDIGLEDGRVILEAEIVMQAMAQRKERVAYTGDWYAVGRDSSCERTDRTYPVAIRCLNVNFTQSEARTLEETGIPSDARVVDVAGAAAVENLETENGKAVLNGKCRYSLVLSSDGEPVAKEVELPFRYVIDGVPAGERMGYEADAKVITARTRMDGERVAVDGEIALAIRLWSEESASMVCAVAGGEEKTVPSGAMRLCYPAAGESVWNVAKRYHAALDDLMRKNRLPAEKRVDDAASLADVKVIAL